MNNSIKKTEIDFEVSQDNYEICISCSTITDIPKNTHTTLRQNYVDGCGQLCNKCFIRIYGT